MNEFTLLAIDLELPGQPEPSGVPVPVPVQVKVQGAVVRCAKLPDKSPATYELGVYFTEMTEKARTAIAEFVSGSLGGQGEARQASR